MSSPHRLLVPFLVVASGLVATAQVQWMPPNVEQGLAEQLAGRLASVAASPPADPATLAAGARRAVAAVGAQLGSWTDAVAIEKAPVFPQLAMPAAEQPVLDAMVAFQICTMAQFLRFTTGTDPDDRRATALGLTATTMAVMRLRQPFHAAGGTDKGIEAALTSPALGSVLDAVQNTPALLAHVEQRCEPIARELVGTAALPKR